MSSHVHLHHRPVFARPSTLVAASLLSALMLAGCGGGDRAKSEAKTDTQIAATVNQGEISVHQVQVVLQRQPQLAAGDSTTASARVLEGLIDQELGAQAARKASLDKDPRVVQRLEAARREILAQAWQESVATSVRSATSDEVDRYYEQQPQLFAQRRVFVLQESAVEGAPEALAALSAKLTAARTTDEVGTLLQRSGLRTQSRVFAQAAEDLPLAVLSGLAPLEAGQSAVFIQGGQARVYTIVSAQKASVDRRQADRAIGAYLANVRRSEALAQATKQLRDTAKIDYKGNFAQPAAKSASTP
jgi:EpsD family peptidyl-prolyl cis-trans isomerase